MNQITIHNYEAFLLDYAEGNLDKVTVDELKAFVLKHPQLGIELDNTDLPYLERDVVMSGFKDELKKNEEGQEDEALLNYLEHNLSAREKEKFEERLLTEPGLRQDLELYRKTQLHTDGDIRLDAKESLFKTEEEFLLANRVLQYMEGLMVTGQREAFERELAGNVVLRQELELFRLAKPVADASVVYPGKSALKKKGRVLMLFPRRTLTAVAAAALLLFGLFGLFHYYYNSAGLTPLNKGIVRAGKAKNAISPVAPLVSVLPESNSKAPGRRPAPQRNGQGNFISTGEAKQHVSETDQMATTASATLAAESTAQSVNPTEIETHDKMVDNSRAIASTSVNEHGLAEEQSFAAPLTVTNNEGYTSVNQLAVENDEEEETNRQVKKSGFWQRAVSVAKRANVLGLKAVNGEENDNESYMLSFNSLSVEKK